MVDRNSALQQPKTTRKGLPSQLLNSTVVTQDLSFNNAINSHKNAQPISMTNIKQQDSNP